MEDEEDEEKSTQGAADAKQADDNVGQEGTLGGATPKLEPMDEEQVPEPQSQQQQQQLEGGEGQRVDAKVEFSQGGAGADSPAVKVEEGTPAQDMAKDVKKEGSAGDGGAAADAGGVGEGGEEGDGEEEGKEEEGGEEGKEEGGGGSRSSGRRSGGRRKGAPSTPASREAARLRQAAKRAEKAAAAERAALAALEAGVGAGAVEEEAWGVGARRPSRAAAVAAQGKLQGQLKPHSGGAAAVTAAAENRRENRRGRLTRRSGGWSETVGAASGAGAGAGAAAAGGASAAGAAGLPGGKAGEAETGDTSGPESGEWWEYKWGKMFATEAMQFGMWACFFSWFDLPNCICQQALRDDLESANLPPHPLLCWIVGSVSAL
ncbi:hypothetical protein DUNSADRAFT_17533 [Dunaliella salina]|uniref:Uncharacterized protein n=1 Tax=Dunaliella salina TaxID=3046 RepID=A0ABQ7H009_DUNSA|nr:hypothetical protein DUNSADRAFT_17533 [Dunaliella salina]|eukprot:KAF5840186.1 hypothetical protein DUNSADRAFT_17533 [Dunaliella salina]